MQKNCKEKNVKIGGTESKAKAPTKDASRLERMRKDLEDARSKGQGEIHKLADGKTTVRILPPIDEDGDWYFSGWYHYRIGPDSNALPCPKMLKKKGKCPICEKADELFRGDETDKKIAKHLKPKQRIFANVFIPGIGTKVLAFGKTVYTQLLGYYLDPEWGMLDDMETGHNVTIIKAGEGFSTTYETRPQPKPKPLEDVIGDLDLDEVLAQRKDLHDYVELMPYDAMQELLEATDLDDLLTRNPGTQSAKAKKKKTDDD
jgi:hypothetical protein